MAEPEKSLFENQIAGPSGWPEAYHQLQQLIGARGEIPFLLAAAALFVWWKWDDIVKRPGVERLIRGFNRSAVSSAPAGHLTVAVAHLARDQDQEHENLLLDELRQFEGAEVLRVDRTVNPDQPDEKKAEEEARSLLRKTGSDVLIWGSVISLSGKSAMRLNWTPARDTPGAKSTGKYPPQTDTIALPLEFWSDLKQILGLLTQSRLAELAADQSAHYVADRLAPLIVQVRILAESRQGVWNPVTLAGVWFGLATALAQYGEQTGQNESLAESIAFYRKILDKLTRASTPIQWANTQNNLGIALAKLGGRERGSARLDEAIAAYREALKEFTRERVPLQWAATQMNLGNALVRVYEQKNEIALLNDTIEAYHEALKEWTRAQAPLQWAMIQNNLGTALFRLGEHETETARLEEAVAAYHDALQEFTRARVPLDWAKSTGNQGFALMFLAERRGDAKLAVRQIEAGFTTSRDGGDAPSAAVYEAQLPKARAIRDRLTASELKPSP